MSADWTVPFETVLLVEGEVDRARGWLIRPGALRMPEAPLPLRRADGEVVGRVDAVWRDGNRIMGRGVRRPCLADELISPDDAAYSIGAIVKGSDLYDVTDAEIADVMVHPRQIARPSE